VFDSALSLLIHVLLACIALIGRLCEAHKLYPVRVRLVNDVSGTVEWVTVAYVPIARKLQEPGADERARSRRCGILQLVIYTAFTHVIGRSHIGFRVRVGHQKALAFPRVLLYICDQPEERAVLGLKGGKCAHPCTSCMAKIDIVGAPQALNAEGRNVINTRGFRISDFMQQSDTIFGCQRAFQIYFLTRTRFPIKISPFDRSPDQSFFLNHVFVRFLI